MKKVIRITESNLNQIVKESIKIILKENKEEEPVVWAQVHYYDAKGRQYRLDYLADNLRRMGVKVDGTGFEDDYDGYVDIYVTLEQAKMLDKKYPNSFYIKCARQGNTIEEIFANALERENMINKILNHQP